MTKATLKNALLLFASLVLFGCRQPAGPSLASGVEPLAIVPDPSASLASPQGWERKNATFYQVWVSAFADSDGNGVGDLAGITQKIDAAYFTDLGVNAIWLSPVFKAASLAPSSTNKHGYDTIDYTTVDPIF